MMTGDFWAFIFGQGFGILAMLCAVISVQMKRKRPLMIFQTVSEALIVAQYFVKGAFTGSLMSIVSFVRNIIFTKYDKKRAPIWILIILYVVMTVLTITSWAGPISLLPYAGSLVYTWSLWYGKVKWIRLGNMIGNTPYLIYTILTGNFVLFLMTLIEVISAGVGFLRLDVLRSTSVDTVQSRNNTL